ncbi:secreted protein [Melampsora americana]|nr:secreted protein [Melampsora americana]
MKLIILGFYISIACRVRSAVVGLQAMVPPAYVSPPAIYGYGPSHAGAASAIEWRGGIPEMYRRRRLGKLAEEVLLDDDQQNKALLSDRLDKEVLLDDKQQKELLSSDSNAQPIEARRNSHDLRKKVLKSSTVIAPTIEPPMQRTVYTEEQMKHLKNQIKYRLQGFNYKYDLEHDEFYQLDKSRCDCSGYCGRIKIFDSLHPDQLVYETSCCYCGGHWRNKYQGNLGESCLSLALASPLAALVGWCKLQTGSSKSKGYHILS